MMDRKNIVGIPNHVGVVAPEDPLQFIGHGSRLSPAVCFTVHLVAAPLAFVGASSSGDHGHGSGAMMLTPGFKIALDGNGFAAGPRLPVNVGNLRARRRKLNQALFPPECDTMDPAQILIFLAAQHGQEFLQCHLSLANDDHVCPRRQVFFCVRARFRSPNHRFPACILGGAQDAYNTSPCHEICVNPQHGRTLVGEKFLKLGPGRKSGVKNLDFKTPRPQVRSKVKNPQWCVGLHDLKLLGIVAQEETVG